MGVPIDLDSLLKPPDRQARPALAAGPRVALQRRGSSFTAANSLISSRGTMNGALTIRRLQTHALRTAGQMRHANVEGFMVLWDKFGSEIVVVSPFGDVAVHHVTGGISPDDELLRVSRLSWNEFLFASAHGAVLFACVQGVVQFERWRCEPLLTAWRLPQSSAVCCVLRSGQAVVTDDPRRALQPADAAAAPPDAASLRMTRDLAGHVLLEPYPAKNVVAVLTAAGRLAILRDAHMHDVPGLALATAGDKIVQLQWSETGRFLCILTAHRIVVYDTADRHFSVVAGETPAQLVCWGLDTLFLLSTHLYATMLKAFEYNAAEQQWICCGFEDIRSQFNIASPHGLHVTGHANSVAVYHAAGVHTFSYCVAT